LNKLYWKLSDAGFGRGARESPYEFYQAVECGSALFQGLCDATNTHDEGWRFVQLGKFLERAAKTLRILDIQYHLLHELTNPDEWRVDDEPPNGSVALPVWWWNGRHVPSENVVHIPWFPIPGRIWGLSPMAAYAATTDRIGIGSGVVNCWTRNVGLLAATFVTYELSFLARLAWWRGHDPASTAFMDERLARVREKKPDAKPKHQWVPQGRIPGPPTAMRQQPAIDGRRRRGRRLRPHRRPRPRGPVDRA